MEKKYELTNETIVIYGRTLHRIRALRDIPRYKVKVGDLGGYIENENNLFHDGDAWVNDHAMVFGDACVFQSARVYGDALIYDNAWVYGRARVFGDSQVYDCARVFGAARVFDHATVFDAVNVFDNAQVFGNVRVPGRLKISGNAYISSTNDFFVVGPIGSRDGYTTFYRTKDKTIWVNCGCFNGSIDDFLKKVDKTHGHNDYVRDCYAATDLARNHIKLG